MVLRAAPASAEVSRKAGRRRNRLGAFFSAGLDNSQAAPRTGLDGRLGERPGLELRLDIDRRVSLTSSPSASCSRKHPSLNGARRSGRLVAEAVLTDLGLASEKRRPTER